MVARSFACPHAVWPPCTTDCTVGHTERFKASTMLVATAGSLPLVCREANAPTGTKRVLRLRTTTCPTTK